MRAARRTSMIIGLALAVAVAAVMYAALFRSPAPPRGEIAGNPAHQAASDNSAAPRRLAAINLASAPSMVGLDPHGTVLAVVTRSGRVAAWSASDGRRLSRIVTPPDAAAGGYRSPGSPMFSPDGKEFFLLTGDSSGGETAHIWNVTTQDQARVPLPSGSATPGPDGLIAESYSNVLGVTDMATGLPPATLAVLPPAETADQTSAPVFSPDGHVIAISDDQGRVYLVSVPGRRIAAVLTAEKIYNSTSSLNGLASPDIDSVAFSPDSTLVACGSEDGIVRVWDVATGRNVAAFSVSGAPGSAAARPVKTLVFSPDGKMLVTADHADSTVAVWDVASGREAATLDAGTGYVASAAFTADGTLLVATTSSRLLQFALGAAKHQSVNVWAFTPGPPAKN